ncbi:hypothetical protein EV702DRAFT_1270135 [Suillus placidus]|uniref:Uncharacterized protein n=1 Tax=Suillus placidus TaxID=48579 RepID=A0A9P7D0L2_9AGAM|nr:hypothetical protein EV702DRAFT_1270135 [Suillus placidus]
MFQECTYHDSGADTQLLIAETWILVTVWELLALCLAVWIVIKHLRELRRPSTGWTVQDCFTVLNQTHLLTLQRLILCRSYLGILQILVLVEVFVLGSLLILGVRGYHAKLVAADEAAGMVTLEHARMSTGSDVQHGKRSE